MAAVLRISSFLLVLLLEPAQRVAGFPFYQDRIPNVGVGTSRIPVPINQGIRLGTVLVTQPGSFCQSIGHVSQCDGAPSGSGNSFGRDFNALTTFDGVVCRMDSDGDSFTNGDELGDPDCQFELISTPNRTTCLSHPGFSCSTPCDPFCEGRVTQPQCGPRCEPAATTQPPVETTQPPPPISTPPPPPESTLIPPEPTQAPVETTQAPIETTQAPPPTTTPPPPAETTFPPFQTAPPTTPPVPSMTQAATTQQPQQATTQPIFQPTAPPPPVTTPPPPPPSVFPPTTPPATQPPGQPTTPPPFVLPVDICPELAVSTSAESFDSCATRINSSTRSLYMQFVASCAARPDCMLA